MDAGEIGTRDRILRAAVAMIGKDPSARLSVRAVADRAGVSAGSLRHHFPTQRGLRDAVIAGIYDAVAPDTGIRDRTVPARERLLACVGEMLAPTGVGDQARVIWGESFRHFIDPEPTAAIRATYSAIDREAHHRIEHWLTILAEEGALPAGDNARRARFLLTVINGLSIERALPSTESVLATEIETLNTAVDYVLNSRAEANADPAIRRYNGDHDRLGRPSPPPSTADAEVVLDSRFPDGRRRQ